MAEPAAAPRKIKCAINGFGRVGRIVARCGFFSDQLEIVHINEPGVATTSSPASLHRGC